MSESDDARDASASPTPSASSTSPVSPLVAKVVAGVQGGITALYLSLVGFVVAPRLFDGVALGTTKPVAAVAVLVGFAAGYRWVSRRRPVDEASARRATARRGAVVVHLLVLGFALPFVVRGSFALSGRPVVLLFPLFDVAVAYALALVVSYGLVYGLGVRLFPDSNPATDTDLQE